MDLCVDCKCGQRRPVTPASCGSEIKCLCGESIAVPKLSDVRRACGKSAYATTPVERLRTLRKSGELPPTRGCGLCGLWTPQTVDCIVQCESHLIVGESSWDSIVRVICEPLSIITLLFSNPAPEVHGRSTGVRIPVPICVDCKPRFVKSDKHRKEALGNIALYSDLLREYPDLFTIVQ